MEQIVIICKALADRQRLRILAALTGRELCVCQIIALIKLAPSSVSKHLYILKMAGLISGEKRGKWIYYKLSIKSLSTQVSSLLRTLLKTLKATEEIKKDTKELEKICSEDLEKICKTVF